MKNLRADLHFHSIYSDGVLTPQELLARAQQANLNLVALTDHDNINGVQELQKAALGCSIKVINGIELSVKWKKHDIHILGLNFESDNVSLKELIAIQDVKRRNRAVEISSLLEGVGVENAYEKARAIAGHDLLTRPHFANVLLQESKVQNINEAFKKYLKRGRLAYVATNWITLDDAVAGIVKAGGVAVIAHPLKYKLSNAKLCELIELFKTVGGKGLEVVSGFTSISEKNKLINLCKEYDLLASTGSDYHNDNYSFIKLGCQQQLNAEIKPIWSLWE